MNLYVTLNKFFRDKKNGWKNDEKNVSKIYFWLIFHYDDWEQNPLF